MTDSEKLAAALVARRVTPERISKLKAHIRDQAHYDAIRAALPEDVRQQVIAQLGATWKAR